MSYELADGTYSTEYKVGDKFVVVVEHFTFPEGTVVTLVEDDESKNPWFTSECISGSVAVSWYELKQVKQQFSKSDLKDGMVVKYRGGSSYADKNNGLRLVLCEQFIGSDGFAQFREYSEGLLLESDGQTFDIVEVFTVVDASEGLDHITDWKLKSIWKREEPKVLSPEQLEIEKIQAEMYKLNKRLGELKAKV